MDVITRMQQLKSAFSYEQKIQLEGSRLQIMPFHFTQTTVKNDVINHQQALSTTGFCPETDDRIVENKRFKYIAFSPEEGVKSDRVIVLLHGLNERSWDKYLPWAEYLCMHTHRPVILFPMAFHMNRTPAQWNNPRMTMPWVNERKQQAAGVPNSTFANVVLSSRISQQPLRIYTSGLESLYDLMQLARDIKEGRHPLFRENASVDLFAYSIGALLSQVLLLSNPEHLFSDTRLFMFCGGSIFCDMNGSARDILDKEASEKMLRYYETEFLEQPALSTGAAGKAFKMMIKPEILQEQREDFFYRAANRIRAVSLKKDTVITTGGIRKALGKASKKILEELDFQFDYSHQIPFPSGKHIANTVVNRAFRAVFDRAVAFYQSNTLPPINSRKMELLGTSSSV